MPISFHTTCAWLLVLAGCAKAAHEPETVTLPPMPPVAPSSVPAEPTASARALAPVADPCSTENEGPSVSGGSSTAPFDRGAAQKAIAGARLSCCKHDAPVSGHITLTFDNAGHISSAVLDQGSLAGTPVGDCVVAQFKAIRVPAFGGTPVRVGKSFALR